MKITTDRECAAARTDKAREDFRIAALPGLFLRVTKSGRTGANRERRMPVGSYPETKLAAALHAGHCSHQRRD